jgi:GNAT superfamily N-acetyltransferase
MQSGNNRTVFTDLVFERIDDASILSNFYCGIPEMDSFMISGFIPKPNIALENQEYLSENEFPAVEITYLAVEKDWRGQGIGEYIISQVERKVQRERPECEFITVEAYITKGYSAVGFYNHCDFTPAEPPTGYKDTLRMYKVLHPITLPEKD